MADEPGKRQAGAAGNDEPRSPAFFEYWNQLDMLSWMGARITDSAEGHATVYFEPGSHHRGAGVGGRGASRAARGRLLYIVPRAAGSPPAPGTQAAGTPEQDGHTPPCRAP